MPKKAINTILSYLLRQWLQERRQGVAFPNNERHHSFIFQYYKAFNMKNRMALVSPHGKALCLLKTQFAKKPKNPV